MLYVGYTIYIIETLHYSHFIPNSKLKVDICISYSRNQLHCALAYGSMLHSYSLNSSRKIEVKDNKELIKQQNKLQNNFHKQNTSTDLIAYLPSEPRLYTQTCIGTCSIQCSIIWCILFIYFLFS